LRPEGAPAGGVKTTTGLRSHPCPEGFSHERWERLREGASRFAEEWADKALSLGWTHDELFVIAEPFANVSLQGVAWFVGDATIISVTTESVTLRRASGAITRLYRKRPNEKPRP